MARGKTELPPKMQLRQKTSESQKHPAKVADYDWKDDPSSKVTIGEKVEGRAQKKEQKEKAEKARKIGQVKLAAIEDRLRREDVDRELSANHPPVAVTPGATEPRQPPQTASTIACKVTSNVNDEKARPRATPRIKTATPAPPPKPTVPAKVPETPVAESGQCARRTTTVSQTTQSKLNNVGAKFDESDDSDVFVAPVEDDNDEEDKDTEGDNGGEKRRVHGKTPSAKRKADAVRDSMEATSSKKSGKSARSAVIASRSTTDAVGTPTPKPKTLKRKVSGHPAPIADLPIVELDHEEDAAPEPKKRKTDNTLRTEDDKKNKKSKKKSGNSLSAKFEKLGDDKAKAIAYSTPPDEDSLVNVGASMVNENEPDDNEFVDLVKKEPGDSKLSIIAITPGNGPRTAKEARGGTKKWLVNVHIPGNAFKHGLLRLFKTSLALSHDPWAALTANQVQKCVDTEFGPDVYQVGPKGAWVACANYRLGDYRHDFPEAAAKVFLKFVNELNPEHFTGPEDIAEYVNWALEKDKAGTAPMHWKSWGGGTHKSGILRHFFIIEMLLETYYLSMPDIEDPRTAPRPIGLILLSEQAISRELSLWTTGYRSPSKRAPQFSKQNYGDITELKNLDPKKYGEGVYKQQNHKRGSFFLKTMLSWTDDKWEAFLTDVKEAVEDSRPSQHKASSAQPEAIEDDDDMIFASDPPEPTDDDVPMADGEGARAAGIDGDSGSGDASRDGGDGDSGSGDPSRDGGGNVNAEGDEAATEADVAQGEGDDGDVNFGDGSGDVEEEEEEGQLGEGLSSDGGIPVASDDDDDSSSSDSD